ncbi:MULTISPECIES: hypothetical protein [Nocardia]|uniref:DUF8020 domain-containing protein n=1 Tax=Nocardia aurea TaxID=2144174 RepID=A0ABV3FYN5_9NOCA|nr:MULTISPECIES: hypothetical protein [Nocardia]
MKFRSSIMTAALAAVALGVSAGASHAAPAPEQQQDISYEVTRQGDSAVVTLDSGKLRVVADQLVITDDRDTPVAALPLSYRMDALAYPISANIDGRTATLTPTKDAGTPVAAVSPSQIVTADQVAESFTPRDLTALGALAQRITIGSAVSAVVGAVLGGGVGCLLGAAGGAAIASPVIALLLPFVGAAIAGCVLGAATFGAVGGMVGLITVGGPLALFAAFQYFSTILAPCPAELPYCKDPAVPAPAPAK